MLPFSPFPSYLAYDFFCSMPLFRFYLPIVFSYHIFFLSKQITDQCNEREKATRKKSSLLLMQQRTGAETKHIYGLTEFICRFIYKKNKKIYILPFSYILLTSAYIKVANNGYSSYGSRVAYRTVSSKNR